MSDIRHYFSALLKNINPSPERRDLAQSYPATVRDWLKQHSFKTIGPHTRLSGSYARFTAIQDIKDVDILLFLPESELERTPNAVLRDVKKALDEFPDAKVDVSGQRRSVRMDFSKPEIQLDIVPSVALDDVDKPLEIPDRPAKEWIDSDPLGYAQRLSDLNQENGEKVVPLIKLIKAWRDIQMKTKKPKSYVIEVMIVYAIEGGHLILENSSYAKITADFFAYIADKYDSLMENGKEAPRIKDPQISKHLITRGWERSHFETFMRRIRESSTASAKAIEEGDMSKWKKVFLDLWPSEDEAKKAAKAEASSIQPGATAISSAGLVIGSSQPAISTRPTKYHGHD